MTLTFLPPNAKTPLSARGASLAVRHITAGRDISCENFRKVICPQLVFIRSSSTTLSTILSTTLGSLPIHLGIQPPPIYLSCVMSSTSTQGYDHDDLHDGSYCTKQVNCKPDHAYSHYNPGFVTTTISQAMSLTERKGACIMRHIFGNVEMHPLADHSTEMEDKFETK